MLWLYGIVDAGSGAGTEPEVTVRLRGIRSGEVAALAEEVDEPRPLRLETLREHDRIVRGLAACLPSLLPARFGQTAADDQALLRRLAEDQSRLAEALDHVRGCVQVTVQIHGDAPGSAAAGAADDEPTTGVGRRYLRGRLEQSRIAGLDELRRHVQPWVRETRSRRGPKPALASAYHLVPKEDIGRLIAAARDFVPPGDLRLRVGEPAPAYAFTSPGWSLG